MNGIALLAFIPIAALGVIGQPALQAILSRATADDSQGVLQGVLSSLTAISMIVAPIAMTWVFAEFTGHQATIYFPGTPFVTSALLMIIALMTFIKITPKPQNRA